MVNSAILGRGRGFKMSVISCDACAAFGEGEVEEIRKPPGTCNDTVQ